MLVLASFSGVAALAQEGSPRRIISFIPAVAALVLIQGGVLLAGVGKAPGDLVGATRLAWDGLLVLGNGFIVTALLWGSVLVAIVERRRAAAAAIFGTASLAALVGIIHSPLPSGALFWPGAPGTGAALRVAGAYGLAGAVLLLLADRRARAGASDRG